MEGPHESAEQEDSTRASVPRGGSCRDLLMRGLVKVWTLRMWLPMIFGIGVALSGWLSRLRSQDFIMNFQKGIQLVGSSPGGKVAMKQDTRLSSSASYLLFAEPEAPSLC